MQSEATLSVSISCKNSFNRSERIVTVDTVHGRVKTINK